MLVKPTNLRLNAVKWAIQTFKADFISALATTDSNFQLQLWDCHTPHVEAMLNLLCPSRIDPTVSAYEVVWPVRLEMISSCTPRVQSSSIQNP
jgi:hypothetical protein